MGYDYDRAFTNYIHKKFAVPIIYKALNWAPQTLNEYLQEIVDLNNGIDYFAIDLNRKSIVTIQERFREERYAGFNDITIRYEREFNDSPDRILSEFYKTKADYLMYGVVDAPKYDIERATGFVKYVILDLRILKKLFKNGQIIIDKDLKTYHCIEKNGKIVCPVNYNRDQSSSFIPIDIKLLKKLFFYTRVVYRYYGY